MLLNLKIKNFAIIDDLDIDFECGMNVLVGETGAGKSIIISALSLLSGARSSFDKLKNENEKAFIEGAFLLSDETIARNNNLSDFLSGDKILVVTRLLLPNKTSVCKINSHIVSINVLKDVMEDLIDIHSQHDSLKLLNEDYHIELLDKYIKNFVPNFFDQYKIKYHAFKECEKELRDFKKSLSQEEDRDYLQFQINEIEKAHLEDDEIETIEEKLSSLSNVTTIQEEFSDFSKFYEEDEVGNFLDQLKGKLSSLKNPFLNELSSLSLDKFYELTDTIDAIYQKISTLDIDPYEIDQLNNRLYQLQPLQHKFGRSTAEIKAKLLTYQEKLNSIDNFEDEVKRLEEDVDDAYKAAEEEANLLSQVRHEYAEKLSLSLQHEFTALALNGGKFKINFIDNELSDFGSEEIKFLISLNEGSRFTSLKETVSGGENSRLMLALKIIFNELSPADLLVFDEIDTGISGNVAFKVAIKIHEISISSQVIVITHLPQVVARGDNHFRVYKIQQNNTTFSSIIKLSNEEVIEEIAHMISNEEISVATLNAAKELIETIKKE